MEKERTNNKIEGDEGVFMYIMPRGDFGKQTSDFGEQASDFGKQVSDFGKHDQYIKGTK